MFKKIISTFAVVAFAFSMLMGCASNVTCYKTFGTIEPRTCADNDDGAIIDDMGYEWYYDDRPDLYEGERVLVVFHDNGTPENLCDDVIIYIIPAGNEI